MVNFYFTRTKSRATASHQYLGQIEYLVRLFISEPVLVLGDFNAHSETWGNSRNDGKGRVLQNWASDLSLSLFNRGSVSTCVRWQGESVVDLSWATASAARLVTEWRVMEDVVTLSDHRHIVLNITLPTFSGTSTRDGRNTWRCWALKKLDKDKLLAAAHIVDWSKNTSQQLDPERYAIWFQERMKTICDMAMPRIKQINKRSAYWWSEHIAQLRRACLSARRHYLRTRRRRMSTEEERLVSYRSYRSACIELQKSILDAKSKAWDELITGLDIDPWGRPYKIVLKKLRPWVPPITERLDPLFISSVIEALFPQDSGFNSVEVQDEQVIVWDSNWSVAQPELDWAMKRLAGKNTAPGPDGIPARVWVIVHQALGGKLRELFTDCLMKGVFPKLWKIAKLVLLQKEGRPSDSPAAYRPICLLDEIGKIFERIIADRINNHLDNYGPSLSPNQYGFRKRRSTVDAILRVKELVTNATCNGRKVLAISIDIVNAFNTVPWRTIKQALIYHRVPPYLRRVLRSYLSERCILYIDKNGIVHMKNVECGVPQGSVLGPLLWNLAYDEILRTVLLQGINLICYADDTLMLIEAMTFQESIRLAELAVAKIVAKLQELGLRVAPQKTEAMWFCSSRSGITVPNSVIRVCNVDIQIGLHLRYLGLTLDRQWNFTEHFKCLAPRLHRIAGALRGILPNLRGPREEVRRLYANVIRSIALYGAPVWFDRLVRTRSAGRKVLAAQRSVLIRVARGYKTISYEAAYILSRIPPLNILAEIDAKVFYQLRTLWGRSDPEIEGGIKKLRETERNRALLSWHNYLQEPNCIRQRVVLAILPNIHTWMNKKEGTITFRLTQVFTGHGCFGDYLFRIGKWPSPNCHHCDAYEDTAQHTLEWCPA